jgi:hypothetical protein
MQVVRNDNLVSCKNEKDARCAFKGTQAHAAKSVDDTHTLQSIWCGLCQIKYVKSEKVIGIVLDSTALLCHEFNWLKTF